MFGFLAQIIHAVTFLTALILFVIVGVLVLSVSSIVFMSWLFVEYILERGKSWLKTIAG